MWPEHFKFICSPISMLGSTINFLLFGDKLNNIEVGDWYYYSEICKNSIQKTTTKKQTNEWMFGYNFDNVVSILEPIASHLHFDFSMSVFCINNIEHDIILILFLSLEPIPTTVKPTGNLMNILNSFI